jgi:hypothetical protein
MSRHFSRVKRHTAVILATAAASCVVADTSSAINIVLSYNAASSQEPAGDPTGSLLTSLMQQVKSTYEDIFEDSHTITITFFYAPQSPGVLAAHSLTSQSGGRETAGTIQFDPTAQGTSWFFDPTPNDNSEFTMSQTLFRSLTATQKTNFYNAGANIPSTFEAGFTGTNNGSNATVAGKTDLLSVAFHETGHSLGMSASNTTTQTETGDSDYDYDTINLFGSSLAAKTSSAANVAHLASTVALMTPAIGTAARQLPSHTDLFCMAAVHNYTALDIPRREFYGGTNWNLDANWTGNTIPGSADEAFVRASGPAGETHTATLSAAASVGILHVAEASNVDTGAFSLSVFDSADIDGLDSDIFVSAGGTLTLFSDGTLTVQNTAQLSMTGGQVTAGTVLNNANITGQGTISVAGSLINNGSISLSAGTTTLSGAGSINLDGNVLFVETGAVFVTAANSDLVVSSALSDDFNGDMTIGNSNSVTMSQPWTLGGIGGTIALGRDGVLNLNGGSTSATAAVLGGGTATIIGDINVGTSNYGTITAPVIFSNNNGGAEVLVNGTLELGGDAVYLGGSHTGAGRLVWDENVTIAASTTIGVAELDLDGFLPLATLTINDAVSLTVNSLITDASSGTINILGTMNVNGGNWTNDTGTIILNSGTIGGTSSFTNQDTLTVLAGTSSITTNASFAASSNNSITGILALTGASTTIAGGTWSGAGTLRFDLGVQTFTANTNIAVANFDMDGGSSTNTVVVNPGVTALVSSTGGLANNVDFYDATLTVNSGTFTVSNGGWTNLGTTNLNDTGAGTASLRGPSFTNFVGGIVNISGPATGGGAINTSTFANSGTLHVLANSTGRITGTTTFNSTSRVNVDAGGNLQLNGATTFLEGLYTGAGVMTQNGDATFSAETTIDIATYDWDGNGTSTSTTVNPGVTLTINSNFIEDDGDAHDGIITINSGTVNVNTLSPWRKTGLLNMVNSGAGTPTLAGQQMQLEAGTILASAGPGLINASLRVNSNGTINSTTTLTQSGTFVIQAGQVLTKVGAGTFAIAGSQGHGTGTLQVNAGTVTMATDGGTNLRVATAAGSITFGISQHINRLDIGAGGFARLNSGANKVLRTGTLTIAGAPPTGKLDLTDNDAIIDYGGASPATTVRTLLIAGRASGAWTGNGIASSTAAAVAADVSNTHKTALGYAEASALSLASFSGEAVDATAICIRYTFTGDANIDGVVNSFDFNALATNFGGSGKEWVNADFNYDGTVNSLDFNAIATNFALALPAPPAVDGALVPEPAGLGIIAALMCLRKRARRPRPAA